MKKGRSFRSTARMVFAAPVVALFACNAILGADDYKVGEGDAGSGGDPSQGDGGSGNMGTGGRPGTGETTGNGGKATGNGGKATGTGGLMPPGGAPGTGGKGGSGAVAGTGGSSGSLTAADFIGEWDTDKETQTLQCDDGLGPMSMDFMNSIEWTAGTGGTIETYNGSCLVVARISGRVATVVPAPPCDDMGITYSNVSGTFTILPDGTAKMDRKIDFYSPPDTCSGTATGIYTKYLPP